MTDIELRKGGKLTDIMVFGLRGFIVSTKVKNILSQCNLPNHTFHALTIYDKHELPTQYWWFVYDKEKGEESVDFKNSVFDFSNHKQYPRNTVIENYEMYMDIFYKSGRALKATKLVFYENFSKHDIWGTQFLSLTEGYISEKLHELLLKNNVTGFRATEPRCKLLFKQ